MENRKLKIQALLVLFAVLCICLVGSQLSNWIMHRAAFQQSEKALQQAGTAPETLAIQRQKLAILKVTGKKQQAAIKSGGELLSYVEAACRKQGVTLLSLPQERQLSEDGNPINELRFSLEGRLQDILTLSHRWEYRERIGRLTYFKLARENIRMGRKKETKLIASLRFKRLL